MADKHQQQIHDLDRLLSGQLKQLVKCIGPAYSLGLKGELHAVREALQAFHDKLADLHREDAAH